jgi:uncharacterized YigZ family protein
MDTGLYRIGEGGVGELTEKKSRFIATIAPVTTAEEAQDFIAAKKKEYWDARHNCSAYIIGERGELARCSDDGEPAQTAGRPMLDVLTNRHLTNVVVVVTRYFGGVLLGTGGLVRAYQGAVKEALEQCSFLQQQEGYPMQVTVSYAVYGKLEHWLGEVHLAADQVDFGSEVTLSLQLGVEEAALLEKQVTELSGGDARIEKGPLQILLRSVENPQ